MKKIWASVNGNPIKIVRYQGEEMAKRVPHQINPALQQFQQQQQLMRQRIPQVPQGQMGSSGNISQRQFWQQVIPANPVSTQEAQLQRQTVFYPTITPVNPQYRILAGTEQFFNNQTLIRVDLNSANFELYRRSFNTYFPLTTFTESYFLELIKLHIYNPLMVVMTSYIDAPDAIVPAKSHRLRNTMMLSLRGGAGGSNYTKTGNLHPFQVVLNTGNIKYAPWVNLMPTEWLQHPGIKHGSGEKGYKKSRKQKKTPYILYDPNAQNNWFQKCVKAGQDTSEQLWDFFINNIFSQIVDPYIIEYNRYPYQPGYTYLTLGKVVQDLFTVAFA